MIWGEQWVFWGILGFSTLVVGTFLYLFLKTKSEKESLPSLEEELRFYRIIFENVCTYRESGILVTSNDKILYINDIFLKHSEIAGINVSSRQELEDILENPHKVPGLYDFLMTVKEHRDTGNEFSKTWYKDINGVFLEIKFIETTFENMPLNIIITKEETQAIRLIENQILNRLIEVLEEKMLSQETDIKIVGDEIKNLLSQYGLVDAFAIGILKEDASIHYEYLKYHDDDKSGGIAEPESKTLSRYIIDRAEKVYVPDSTDFDLPEGYYLKVIQGGVFTIYGVPILNFGIVRGVVLYEKIGKEQYNSEILKLFDRITGIISIWLFSRDILNQIELERQKYYNLSMKDSLTGAYTRAFLEEFLNKQISRLKRTVDDEMSLVFLDIDKFKHINDTYGHIYGDKVLKKVVEIIKQTVRTMDVVARWGGDEFIIVFPNTKVEDAELVMKRICEKLGKENVSISYGVIDVKGFEDVESLYKEVDRKMYEMKNSSKWW